MDAPSRLKPSIAKNVFLLRLLFALVGLVASTAAARASSPVISSAGTAVGTIGAPFSYQITASNSPTSYTAAGLPTGLSVNPSTGLISGTPAFPGASSVTLGATNASGTGNQALALQVFIDWALVGAADFNGDGKPDLILQNTVNGQRAIWLMNGTTEVSSVSLGFVTTDWDLVGAADFNGDGKPDLIWQNTVNGQRAIWLMNGTTLGSSVSLGTVTTDWDIVGAADFNKNGNSDLILQNTVNGQRAIWLMNGTTYVSSVSLGTVTTDWNLVGAADFNGDGYPDLLWQNTVNGQRAIWLMNGTTYVSSVSLGSVSTDWNLAGAADLNGDGKPDLLWQDMVSRQCAIWLMNGTTETSVVTFTISPPPTAAPSFSPAAGTYTSAQTVTIASTTGGASIAYTTDGSTPTESGGTVTHGILYTTPLTIYAKTTLTAIAFKTGYTDSAATSGTYTINIPASIGGLRLWLEADTGVIANAGQVGTWADQSGNGNNATQTAPTQRATLMTSAMDPTVPNGRPVVRFAAAQNQCFNLPNVMVSATDPTKEVGAGEIFVVVRAVSNTPTPGHSMYQFGGASYGAIYPDHDGRMYDTFGSTNQNLLGAPPVDLTKFNLYNVTASSGAWSVRFNGMMMYSTATNTVSFPAGPVLGGADGNYFDGDIAEVIVYNTVLTQAQRDAINAYLGNKYNLYTAPPAPTSLAATPLSPDQVSLQWSAPARSDHVSYLVERSTGGGSFTQVASVADGLSYIDTGLTAATNYTYRVRAQGYAGTSGYSNTASATTLIAGGGTDLPFTGMRLWLKADAGLSAGNGIDFWADQSGNGNNATQTAPTQRATLMTSAMDPTVPNGRPVVRFAAAQNQCFNLPNVMVSATDPTKEVGAGEIFVVVRAVSNTPTPGHSMYQFGGASYGAIYPDHDGRMYDTFGSTNQNLLGAPPVDLTKFNLYNVTASSGAWSVRFNGMMMYSTATNTVSFPAGPVLGGADGNYFDGDIAEVIVYNRMLNPLEREAVGTYIMSRYSFTPPPLVAPIIQSSQVISSGQVALSWCPQNLGLSYLIERSINGSPFAQIAEVDDTNPVLGTVSYTDTPTGNVIAYRIRAVSGTSISPYGNIGYAFVSEDQIDPTDGLTYEIDALLGLNPLADNSGFLLPYPPPPPPLFSPAAGNYTSSISVSISDTDSAAAIYYTTDGTTPTTASAKYSASIPIAAATTVNAIAVDKGLASAVAPASYTFGTLPPAPIFTLQAPSGATLTTP